ncbi:MAG: Tfp pilus assembly protein PilF [Saprospiraceae bacterium]|jgi:Tfp pilus assembly protein PilF
MKVFPTQRNVFYFVLLFQMLFSNLLYAQVAQNGWNFIVQNDFMAAKSSFEEELKTNPTDEDALAGLIFIAETVQDYKLYKKYSNALIDAKWDDPVFGLYGHLYESDPEKMIKQLDNEQFLARFRFAFADSLFQNRKFKDAEKQLRLVIGDYDWSVIGPFTNVSGSGFLESTPIEQATFDLQKTYHNEEEVELKWVSRKLRDPDGIVKFQNVLPSSSTGMYYANTFITSPEDRTTQLRIARSTPMKIWLDGDLVFENRNNISYNWDTEIVQLVLKAGTHRLLVKCAGYPDFMQSNTLSLTYNDTNDEGEAFDNSNYYNNTYSNNRAGANISFGVRITDTKGKVYRDIKSSFENSYEPTSYNIELQDYALISHFKKEIDKNPKYLKNYYFLCKAYLLYGFIDEGEAYFNAVYGDHSEEVFFKYLLAKFYAANGKGEKAEALISGLDEEKAPFFAIMASELSKIDQEKNESTYLATLDKLLDISPTNWGIITDYLDYYGKKGKAEEKKVFIEKFLIRYPEKDYKELLEPYLKDDSYKPSSYKPLNDKEKEKNAKDVLKRKKKTFILSDYQELISYYTQKEKIDNALKLYDEVIEILPYRPYWRTEKARLLFEKDRLDEALAELNKALAFDEYNSRTYETIGDVYLERGEKEKAHDCYQKSLDLKRISSSYGIESLEEKMEKLQTTSSMKAYFKSITFEEVLKDERCKGQYLEEESIILLYTIESALDKDNIIEYNQKMMIAIQNDAGAKYWTEANFGFLGEINFVKVLKKDGQVVSPSRNYGYVVFKNLEPGDIIQIEGNSKANMTREMHGEMYHIAALSHEVPVCRAKLEFIHPKEQDIFYECYRLDCNPDIREEDAYKILTWEYNDIPKMEGESAVLDDLDSYAWIMFSTQNDWAEIVNWYLRKTYRRLETNYEIENELLTIISEGMKEEEIVEAIYNYVTKEITYSHVSFLNSNYIPKKPSATVSDQIGDCKDVASLMISMLRKYGIEAYYVLVRSSNFTNSKPKPTIMAFNHVIVGYILEDGLMHYLDLTTDYYPYYVIPEFDNNSWALIVREGENDVFRLPNDMLNPDKTRLELNIKAKVNSDRSLVINAATVGKGVLGGKLREELNRVTTEDDRRKFLLQYFGEGSFDHLTLDNFSFKNLEDITAPLEMEMNLKAYNYIERVSNFYILQVPLLNAITTRPTLFSEKRYNNLDLNALFETAPSYQNIELEIPAEFKLMDVPENIRIDNEFGKYEMLFEKTSKGIRINRSLELKTRLIEYKDYAKLKEFYIDLLDADRMKLAVIKS